MYILGINAYHGDSAAALVKDGELIAAVEEERFNRIKHWAGFPAESVRSCLEIAEIGPDSIDHVAVSFDPRANLGRKALFTLAKRPSLRSIVDRLQRQGKSLSIRDHLAETFQTSPKQITAEIHNVEHHDAHLAGGFFVSPYEEAAIVSIDGMGDFVSTVLAAGKGREYEKLSQVYYPHSLGFLYNAVTLYLGFPAYGDEYKVMGLAPYGSPTLVEEFREVVALTQDGFELNLDYFNHHRTGISMSWDDGAPLVEPFHSALFEETFGPSRKPSSEMDKRHENIAASLQVVVEEILFHLLNRLHQRCPSDNLVMVGGVAMNSVANGKVTQQTPFRNVFIPAGAADNGTSFGAAFHIWNAHLNKPRTFQLEHAFWGPEFSNRECKVAAESHPIEARELSPDELLEAVIKAICEGKVVGWFQGRMEFAARALGNRSLIADPRRADMRDIINLKIKFREKFRPFAPSILEERVKDYFEIEAPSPFMEKVYTIRPEKRSEIPAVTHVDGSGRLQSVSRTVNPVYWKLIKRFEEETGVPILLNTSLNENEPIVHTPEEAILCFLRTDMDLLVTGDLLLERAN